MRHVRITGLAHSGWERVADALDAARSEHLTAFNGSLSAALRRKSSGGADGPAILLIYGPPEFVVARSVSDGADAGAALDAWKRDASRALAALDADPDSIWLVHGPGALQSPARAAEALQLSLGIQVAVQPAAPWPDEVLPYLDAGGRIAREDGEAPRLYEDLEASALLASGDAAAVPSDRLNAAVFAHAAQRALDLKLVEGVIRRLEGLENANSPEDLRRQVNGLRVKGCSQQAVDLKAAAALVLKRMAAAQQAVEQAEQAAEAASRKMADRLAVQPPAAEPAASEWADSDGAGAEADLARARRETEALARALDTAAQDARAAEREAEMLREATRLAIEDAASRTAAAPAPAAVDAPAQSAYAPPRRAKGLAKWVWLARAYLALKRSELFDADWYRVRYPDAAGGDVVRHYLLHGGLEGRSPSRSFCSATYLKYYPDVREAGLNPLAHYLLVGRDEGRYMFPALVEADA